MPLPQTIIKEGRLIPRLKPRFYSITNDPFPENESETDFLQFVFSEEGFEKNDKFYKGLCSQFLTNKKIAGAEDIDIKCQMSQAYRVLKFPTPIPDQKNPIQILMIGHGTGIAPFVSMM